MKYIVGVGDMRVGQGGDLLVTYALGSCLGLAVYDPVVRVGGLLHAMLPLSKINKEKAERNPFMFVDKGVPRLFHEVYCLGGKKERLIVKAAGCGQPLGENENFRIGEMNYMILKKLLGKNNICLESADIGGEKSRNVHFYLKTGRIAISSDGVKKEL